MVRKSKERKVDGNRRPSDDLKDRPASKPVLPPRAMQTQNVQKRTCCYLGQKPDFFKTLGFSG